MLSTCRMKKKLNKNLLAEFIHRAHARQFDDEKDRIQPVFGLGKRIMIVDRTNQAI